MNQIDRLKLASEATLLFHSATWTPDQVVRWNEITEIMLGKRSEATTRVLCDLHRNALFFQTKPNSWNE